MTNCFLQPQHSYQDHPPGNELSKNLYSCNVIISKSLTSAWLIFWFASLSVAPRFCHIAHKLLVLFKFSVLKSALAFTSTDRKFLSCLTSHPFDVSLNHRPVEKKVIIIPSGIWITIVCIHLHRINTWAFTDSWVPASSMACSAIHSSGPAFSRDWSGSAWSSCRGLSFAGGFCYLFFQHNLAVIELCFHMSS